MSDEVIYTLTNLVSRLGPATEAEARVLVEGISDADLNAKGADIGTPRLVKELARNYGTFADWLPSATEGQLGLLGFIDTNWLRIAVWCGRQAETLHEQHRAGSGQGTAGKEVRGTTASELEKKGRGARDRLALALRQLSGGIPSWTTRIELALSTSITTSPLADTLGALAEVGAAMLVDPSPGMAARRAQSKLTAEALAEHRALAVELGKAAKDAAAVRTAAPVQQAEVDLWDGLSITYFEQFVEAVEAAHAEDPRIPAPSIIGLRSWFRRTRRKPAEPTPGKKPG